VKRFRKHLVISAIFLTMAPAYGGQTTPAIRDLRCSSLLTCSVEGLQEGRTAVTAAGRFRRYAGKEVSLHLLKFEGRGRGKAKEIRSENVGVLLDGKLRASIPASALDAGKYVFTFTPANAGFKEQRIAKGEFIVVWVQAPASGKSSSGAIPASLVGTWYGTAKTVGTIEMRPDGTYSYGGRPAGTYRADGNHIIFTGSLSAWDNGRATLTNGNLEFYWTNAQGWKQWFSFAKGR
jgi:hypothetical protein